MQPTKSNPLVEYNPNNIRNRTGTHDTSNAAVMWGGMFVMLMLVGVYFGYIHLQAPKAHNSDDDSKRKEKYVSIAKSAL